MKKYILFIVSIGLLTNCVTQKKYSELLNDYLNAEVKNKFLGIKYDSLQTVLSDKNADLTTSILQLKSDSATLSALIEEMKKEIDNQNEKYAKSQQEYLAKLKLAAEKDQRTNADLIQMQLDLEKQKITLDKKETDLKELSKAIAIRESKIAELEKILADQKLKSETLKETIKKALTDFNTGELSVAVKEGKVYISMSDKLLFKSGSTVVEAKGIEVLGKLSEVIKKNNDIQINVEGHTDNIPYSSNGSCIKDNWDLSLLRASAVLHIITDKYKVNAKQIIASGRGEFFPMENNATSEGRAKNRRTEIILTPKMDKLINLLGE